MHLLHAPTCLNQMLTYLHLALLSPPSPLPSTTSEQLAQMGHAAAEALVDAGVKLVPHTFTGMSAGVAVKNIGVRGVATQLVGAEKRQAALDLIKAEYPGMMIVDYTLAHCVEGERTQGCRA